MGRTVPQWDRIYTASLSLDSYSSSITLIDILSDMPECPNCGEFVSEQCVQVFAPTGFDTVRVCPNCPDKLRDEADIRAARSAREH